MPTPINDTIYQMFAGNRLFVIPTFQRPYAWENEQWQDLNDDIQDAVHRPHPFHYFAPIHVVPVDGNQHPLWLNYRDQNNDDLMQLETANFRDQHGAVETLMVVDGQQRLVTLYVLLCAALGAPWVLTLPNGFQIPKVILSPAHDHTYFRALLWPVNQPMPLQVSRSQARLTRLFQFAGVYANPRFPANTHQYAFLTGPNCKTLLIELPAGPQLSSFMTLNDRGKDLSLLEKTKALLMGFDANGAPPHPVPINDAFGAAYLSLDKTRAYLTDDGFLQQVGMAVWGCAQNQIHEQGVQRMYDEHFRRPALAFQQAHPGLNNAQAVHQILLPKLRRVTDNHNVLVDYLDQAILPQRLNTPSFVVSLLPGVQRDAIEDYYAVLNDLKLSVRQIGFLFQVRERLGVNWHDQLGNVPIFNQVIKDELLNDLQMIGNDIQQQAQGNDAQILWAIHNAITQQVQNLPDETQRVVTPLHLAELLRIIVQDSRAGGYSAAWQWTFCQGQPNAQHCSDVWMNYITGYRSRDRFILGVLRRPDVHNNTFWLGYLLGEYESWLAGNVAARRLRGCQIEHLFPAQPGFNIVQAGFGGDLDYTQNFLERVANKLMLDPGLNAALNNLDPLAKLPAYAHQAFNNVNPPHGMVSNSAIEIAQDLNGVATLNAIRLYVRMRAVRLAMFAARRF